MCDGYPGGVVVFVFVVDVKEALFVMVYMIYYTDGGDQSLTGDQRY